VSIVTVTILTYFIAVVFGWPLASPFMEKILTWPLLRYFKYKEKYGEKAEQKAVHHTNIILLLILAVGITLIIVIYS